MNTQKNQRSFNSSHLSSSPKGGDPPFNPLAPFWEGRFQFIVIGVVVLGIVFRLGNLAIKPYWEDEVFTSLLVSGYEIERIQTAVKGRLMPVDVLTKYQEVHLGGSWKDTSAALSKRPEHTPLYFLLARAWAECFGSSITAMRAFPAVSSLLTLPLFYWLARLLFGSSEIAEITLCLACTSPIFIRYAQDTRPYSLWVVGILLSSAMLLHSLQNSRRRNWILYSVSVAFAILTQWLSSFVFLAHGIYVLVIKNRFIWARPIMVEPVTAEQVAIERTTLKHFFTALTVGLLPALPWVWLVVYRRSSVQTVLGWLEKEKTLSGLVVNWLSNVSHLVFARLPAENSWLSWLWVVGPFALLLVGSTVRIVTKRPTKQWLLPVLLCVIPTVAFVVPDLLFGGMRSLISRYFLPTYVGALLILGFGLGASRLPAKTSVERLWRPQRMLFYAVLTISLSASWFNLNADNWWGEPDFSRQAASIITQTSSPVEVYSDQRLSPFMAFSLSLRPTDYVMWLDSTEPLPAEMFGNTRTTFLFEPSGSLLIRVKEEAAKRGVKVALVQGNSPSEGLSRSLFQIGDNRP